MKKLLVTLVVLVALGGAAGLFLTRNTGPTHPGLKSAALPPLIPTRAFYADPRAAYDFVVSSDGTLVAYTQASLLGRSVTVREIATDAEVGELPLGLAFMRWHPTEPLLRFIFEGNDWEVDPRNPDRKNWKRISPVQLSGGWIKNSIAQTADDMILTWGKTCGNCSGDMWLVSQDGLNAEKVADGNDKTVYWVFGENRTPILRVDSLDGATQRVFRKDGDDWVTLIDVSLNDAFYPLGQARADGTVLVRSARGRDKAALVSMDITTGIETVILETPETDIGWTTDITNNGQPDVMRMSSETHERRALTPEGEIYLEILDSFPQPVSIGQTTPTGNGRFVVQTLSPRNQSYLTIKIDLQEKSYVTLNEYHFRRFADHLVMDDTVRIPARDGLDIPAMLLLPKGTTGPVPFVVMIHGGPAQHFGVGYDHTSQFLLNRGYGVLGLNFRGSTGYGKEFQSKGFMEFGRAMQDDVADAGQWLIDEGLADTDALIAMGASYGGYSAALAMMRDEGLFDAAIVEFPMLDVEFQSRHHPGFWNNGIGGWWRYFGQVDNSDELGLMRKYSPSNKVNDLHGPVLILAGVKDQITAVQQARDFETKALQAGKDVTAHYFEDAGHGVDHWRDELRRARLIEDFLATHAGGRSGGFEFVEWAPEFID